MHQMKQSVVPAAGPGGGVRKKWPAVKTYELYFN